MIWGGFPGSLSGKEPSCQSRRCERHRFDPRLEDPWRRVAAAHSSTLAWRISWAEQPGWLEPTGSQRVRHDWSDLARTHWRVLLSCVTLIKGLESSSVQKQKTVYLLNKERTVPVVCRYRLFWNALGAAGRLYVDTGSSETPWERRFYQPERGRSSRGPGVVPRELESFRRSHALCAAAAAIFTWDAVRSSRRHLYMRHCAQRSSTQLAQAECQAQPFRPQWAPTILNWGVTCSSSPHSLHTAHQVRWRAQGSVLDG